MKRLKRCPHCGKDFVPFSEEDIEQAREVLALDGRDGLRTAAEIVGITKVRELYREFVAASLGQHVTDSLVDMTIESTFLDNFTTMELASAHA